MKRELVFVHGRAQEYKDSIALKREWIDAWKVGLRANGLEMPVAEEQIRFPYYGQTLHDLVNNADAVADVVVREGSGAGNGTSEYDEFLEEMLAEVLHKTQAASTEDINARAMGDHAWVRRALRMIDSLPGASGAGVAIATRDVYRYLSDSQVSSPINSGVRAAMSPGVESVVVSHSLGSVVAYQLLRREGADQKWCVPLFVTLGSPLAVKIVAKKLRPLNYPSCAAHWFNALDRRDIVALHPLTFPFTPSIENYEKVKNETTNRHGISGYLGDPEVAKRIYNALVV